MTAVKHDNDVSKSKKKHKATAYVHQSKLLLCIRNTLRATRQEKENVLLIKFTFSLTPPENSYFSMIVFLYISLENLRPKYVTVLSTVVVKCQCFTHFPFYFHHVHIKIQSIYSIRTAPCTCVCVLNMKENCNINGLLFFCNRGWNSSPMSCLKA